MKLLLKLALSALALFSAAGVSAATTGDGCENLEGKSLYVLGDSYVRNHRCPQSETWHAKAAAALGMNYHNHGRNGNCIAYDRTDRGFGVQMTQRYKEIPADADFILIIAGHNDADQMTEGKDPKMFTDSLNYLCERLKTEYPNAKVGFVTPWAVDRPNFAEVIEEIKSTAAKYGFPVLDMAYTSGIRVNDPEFRALYFQNGGVKDTAHLNDAGHNLLVPYGVAFIRLLSAQPRP